MGKAARVTLDSRHRMDGPSGQGNCEQSCCEFRQHGISSQLQALAEVLKRSAYRQLAVLGHPPVELGRPELRSLALVQV